MYNPKADDWVQVGEVNWGDRDGTLSNNRPDGGRDIYLFGIDMIKRTGFVKRAIGGVDMANPDLRVVESLGFEPIAELGDGESYETEIITDGSRGQPRRVRLTYHED